MVFYFSDRVLVDIYMLLEHLQNITVNQIFWIHIQYFCNSEEGFKARLSTVANIRVYNTETLAEFFCQPGLFNSALFEHLFNAVHGFLHFIVIKYRATKLYNFMQYKESVKTFLLQNNEHFVLQIDCNWERPCLFILRESKGVKQVKRPFSNSYNRCL